MSWYYSYIGTGNFTRVLNAKKPKRNKIPKSKRIADIQLEKKHIEADLRNSEREIDQLRDALMDEQNKLHLIIQVLSPEQKAQLQELEATDFPFS